MNQMKELREEDRALIIGALDSMAVALTAHHHQWTTGEREIYEQAVSLLLPTDSRDIDSATQS